MLTALMSTLALVIGLSGNTTLGTGAISHHDRRCGSNEPPKGTTIGVVALSVFDEILEGCLDLRKTGKSGMAVDGLLFP